MSLSIFLGAMACFIALVLIISLISLGFTNLGLGSLYAGRGCFFKDIRDSYSKVSLLPTEPSFSEILQHDELGISSRAEELVTKSQEIYSKKGTVKGQLWIMLASLLKAEAILLTVIGLLQMGILLASPVLFNKMIAAFGQSGNETWNAVILYSMVAIASVSINSIKNLYENLASLKVYHITSRAMYLSLQNISDDYLEQQQRERLSFITSYPAQITQGIYKIDLVLSVIIVLLLGVQMIFQFGAASLVAFALFGITTILLQKMISRIGTVYHEYTASNNGRTTLVKNLIESWKNYERQGLFPLFFKSMHSIREKQVEILGRRASLQITNRTIEDNFLSVISLGAVAYILIASGYKAGSSLFTLLFSLTLIMNAINNYLANYRVVRMVREPSSEIETILDESLRSEKSHQPLLKLHHLPNTVRIMLWHPQNPAEESHALHSLLSPNTALAGRHVSELTGTLEELVSLWDEHFCERRYREALWRAGVTFGREGILSRETLSEGQWGRISLATALYQKPETLLLDNIFSSLDPETTAQIAPRVFGAGRVVYASTRRELSAYATHFLRLDTPEPVLLTREEMSDEVAPYTEVMTAVSDDTFSHLAVYTPSPTNFPHLAQLDVSAGEIESQGDWKADAQVLWRYILELWGKKNTGFLLLMLALGTGASVGSARLIEHLQHHPNPVGLGLLAALVALGIGASVGRYALTFRAVIGRIDQFHSSLLRRAGLFPKGTALSRLTGDFGALEMQRPAELVGLVAGIMVTTLTFGFVLIESRFILLLVLPCLFFLPAVARWAAYISTRAASARAVVRAPAISFASSSLSHPIYREDLIWRKRLQQRFFFLGDVQVAGGYWGQLALFRSGLLVTMLSQGLVLLVIWGLVGAHWAGLGLAYGAIIFVSVGWAGQLEGLLQSWQNAATIRVELDRLAELGGGHLEINETVESQDSPQQSSSSIIFQLNKVQVESDGHILLNDISMDIDKGSIIALVGESGSGKSTLLRVLRGEIMASSGYLERRDNNIILIESHFPILPLTAAEFIGEATIKSEVTQKLCPFPLNKNLSEYTESERQLINLARVIPYSDILLLDEATSSLSTEQEGEVLESLHTSGKTVIAAIHRRNHLGLFEEVYEMKEGKLM